MDAPINQWITTNPCLVYCFFAQRESPQRLHTNVVAVTGPGTAFDDSHDRSLADIDSDTILAIEVADSGIRWAAPGDISLEELKPTILQGLDGEGLHVLFADAEVWFVRSSVNFEDFKKFCLIESARKFDRRKVLAPHSDIRD